MRRAVWVLMLLAAACGRERRATPTASPTSTPTATATPTPTSTSTSTSTPTSTPDAPANPTAAGLKCTRDPSFPTPWKVPEASGAAEVELKKETREILVISDSGRKGAAMAWSAGAGTRALTLPLDPSASDDLEGVAWIAPGRLYTLTSSGAVRTYVPDGAGGVKTAGPTYTIGPPPLSCPDLHDINCNKNWEGLCLKRPGASGPCAGYAASKKETALYCVQRDPASGRIFIDAGKPPLHLNLTRVLDKDVLSDCAFGAEGGPAQDVLLVTTNVFGGSATYAVDEATGHVTPLDVGGTASNEGIAVDHEGAFYVFQDDNGEESAASRYTCSGWPSLLSR